jgi:hypothetical protein
VAREREEKKYENGMRGERSSPFFFLKKQRERNSPRKATAAAGTAACHDPDSDDVACRALPSVHSVTGRVRKFAVNRSVTAVTDLTVAAR